jgi:hypothetical protein
VLPPAHRRTQQQANDAAAADDDGPSRAQVADQLMQQAGAFMLHTSHLLQAVVISGPHWGDGSQGSGPAWHRALPSQGSCSLSQSTRRASSCDWCFDRGQLHGSPATPL